MSSDLVAALLPGINAILGIRGQMGAALKPVNLLTRTWSGTEIGDGTATEIRLPVNPPPRVVQFTDQLRLIDGGAVQEGDILLKQISKATFPTEDMVDCTSTDPIVEKLYEVGGELYTVVSVTEKYVTWNILLRKLAQQVRP